ncbi:hypothetical protein ACFWFI_38465 [Streptomyces sp. NPDC060209]
MTALEVRNLHKRYGQHVAVDDVSFTVEEGEIFGMRFVPHAHLQ